ncbi:MAG: leucine-rich repeat protein [Acutalibacteraceae bacterium]
MKKIFRKCAVVTMAALMAASAVCAGAVSAAAVDKSAETVLPSGIAADRFAAVASGRENIHTASAEDSDSYFEYYVKSDGTVEIMSFVGEDEFLSVPDEIEGRAVTGINEGAFYGNTYLREVGLPDSLVSIGDYAFADCTNLTEVGAKNPSVKSIGNYAFYNTNILYIGISINAEKVGEGAYDETRWLLEQDPGMVYVGKVAYCYKGDMPANKKIELKDGTKGIAGAAFLDCTNLAGITIPESVTNIGEAAFYGCTSLEDITIPSGVTSMGAVALHDTAWYNNQPDGVVYAGSIACEYKGEMPANTKITIKDGTTVIAGAAFANYENLKSVTLPTSLKVIDDFAFYFSKNLSSISIPEGVTAIGKMAFFDCIAIKTVTLPKTVRNIGNLALGFYINESIESFDKMSDFTVKGYKNTEAEYYCYVFSVNFTSLGTQSATEVKLNKTSMTMGLGEVYSIKATVTPNYVNQDVSWSSSNTSVAEVSQSGKITAKATGTATIKATKDGKSASCKITVKKAPTAITLNATSLTLDIGETFDLNSSLPSGEGSYAIYYTSDNPSVASVKKSGGLVTAVAPGSATITATTYNNKTVHCKVTVNEPEPDLILGDLNFDGNANLRDALEIQKIALTMLDSDETKRICGDVDKDGRIRLLDSIYVQKYCLKIPIDITGIGEKIQSEIPTEPETEPATEESSEDLSGYNDAYANEVIRLVNVEREKAGLLPLTKRQDVTGVAQIRSKELTQLFSHTRPNGSNCFSLIDEKNITWYALGENIAAGQSTPAAVMNSWMNSAGHRANILSADFNGIGVACYESGGMLYWTQVFIGA